TGPGDDDTPHQLDPDEAGSYTDGIAHIEVEGQHTLSSDRGLPLWSQGERPAAMLFGWGRGHVILAADPSLLTPRRLPRGAGNRVFLGNVAALHAQDGVIYFDEYYHGIRSSGGFWGYLQYHGQQMAFIPIVMVIAVAVWAAAVRLGPAVPAPPKPSADAVNYASAVARIYQRAGARRLVARGLTRSFLAALARHLQARPSALPAELLAAWRQRHPKKAADQVQSLLRGATELRKGDIGERQLLAWTRACDEFEREVLASPGSRGGVVPIDLRFLCVPRPLHLLPISWTRCSIGPSASWSASATIWI